MYCFDHTGPLCRLQPGSIRINASTSEVVAHQAPGDGRSIFVTDIFVHNTSATPTSLIVKDGASGAELLRMTAPADDGNDHSFATPLRLGPNKGLVIQSEDSVDSLYVSILGWVEQ